MSSVTHPCRNLTKVRSPFQKSTILSCRWYSIGLGLPSADAPLALKYAALPTPWRAESNNGDRRQLDRSAAECAARSSDHPRNTTSNRRRKPLDSPPSEPHCIPATSTPPRFPGFPRNFMPSLSTVAIHYFPKSLAGTIATVQKCGGAFRKNRVDHSVQ